MKEHWLPAIIILKTFVIAINASINASNNTGLMISSTPSKVTVATGSMTSPVGVWSNTSSSTSSSSWNINPSSGPQAGGTFVTLTGSTQQLSDCSRNGKVFVLFGSDQVMATFINSQSVVTSSPSTGYLGDREVWITCNNTIITTNRTFTFRPNPKIINISPQATIAAGGIRQTLIGTNLDSAISLLTGDIQQKMQTRLACELCHAAVYNMTSQFSVRSCIVCQTSGSLNSNHSHISPSSSSSLLGVVNATLVWDAWRHVFPLPVFLNPLVQPLSPDPQDFVANHDHRIQLQVLWPPLNISVSDVTVQMSTAKTNVICGDVVVTSSSLSCRPPSVSNQFVRYGGPEEKTFQIQVSVGNDVTSVGHVTYVLEEPFSVVMIVMIALIGFVFLLSCFYGCLVLLHAQLSSCCPSCCADNSHDSKMQFIGDGATLNGSQPPYQTFGDDTAAGVSQGQGKAGKKRYDGDIEMLGSVKRVQV